MSDKKANENNMIENENSQDSAAAISIKTVSINSNSSGKSNSTHEYWINRIGVKPITKFSSTSDILNYQKTFDKKQRLDEAKKAQDKFLNSIKGSGDIHYITKASFNDVFSRQVNIIP